MEYSLPGSSVDRVLQAKKKKRNSAGKNTGVGEKKKKRILEWVAIVFPGIFPTQGSNPVLLNFR